MGPFLALCRREIGSTLRSPGTWMLLAGFQLVSALFYLLVLAGTESSDLAPLYYNVGWLLLFMGPVITASSFGAEWREGTMELLLTAALKPRHIVLAKFSGAATLLGLAALLSLQYPVWTSLVGSVDLPASLCGAGGAFLLGMTVCAVGTFAAAATRSTAAAAMLGFALSLTLWLLHSLGLAVGLDGGGITDRYSLYLRFGPLTRGIIDTGDVAFLILTAAAFIVMAVTALEAGRSGR